MVELPKNKSFKLSIILIVVALVTVNFLTERRVKAYASGPPTGRTGAPGELTCNAAGCHSTFATNSGTGTLALTGLPAGGYVANQLYTLTITLTQPSRGAFGFEVTAITSAGKKAGTLSTNDNRTQFASDTIGGNLREYILHTDTGTVPVSGNGSWTIKWTAPATSTGKVTFYVAGNAADGTGGSAGDYIYTKSFSVDPLAALPLATVPAASYSATAPVTAEGIVAAFGTSLATSLQSATTLPLPTTLGGTFIKVKDSLNVMRDAPLFFVSAGQVNYQIPVGTANGTATVTLTASDGTISSGTIQVASVSPTLFSANSSGNGVAAASLLRITAGGAQTFEPIAQFDAVQNKNVPLAVSLGPTTDQLFLILFGSGVRGRSSLAATSATIGGLSSEVLFASAQGGFVGLDQINLRVPRTVTKDTDLNVTFTADTLQSNTVTVRFKQ